MKLELLNKSHLGRLYDFELENREWFELWVPPRAKGYFEPENFESALDSLLGEIAEQVGLYHVLIESELIIGRFNISNISQGSGDVGYRVSKRSLNRGYGRKGFGLLVEAARSAGLKRLTAEALTENPASSKLLLTQGFEALPCDPAVVELNGKDMHLQMYRRVL